MGSHKTLGGITLKDMTMLGCKKYQKVHLSVMIVMFVPV